ncbi:MAG: hypothetical protein CM1200mP30_16190 [Pseudomonadota bacterium]|nr:MAG: hypothetical protein CM1200mP30_16190 [Pseudomonadota bacterium]
MVEFRRTVKVLVLWRHELGGECNYRSYKNKDYSKLGFLNLKNRNNFAEKIEKNLTKRSKEKFSSKITFWGKCKNLYWASAAAKTKTKFSLINLLEVWILVLHHLYRTLARFQNAGLWNFADI